MISEITRQQVKQRAGNRCEYCLSHQDYTECGRVTVEILKLNTPLAVTVRKNWVRAGWHPPQK